MATLPLVLGIATILLATGPAMAASPAGERMAAELAKLPPGIDAELDAGHDQELIVLFDATAIEEEAAARRRVKGVREDDAEILELKERRFRQLKSAALSLLPPGAERVRDYSHLPMTLHRFSTKKALHEFLARPEVAEVYPNAPIEPHLTTSLAFIEQTPLPGMGMAGSGTAVAVIDTGINYTLANFGSCSAPGVPAGCRVPVSLDVTADPPVDSLNTDPRGHGSNVAGIVAGVAPGSQIVALNAFSNGASTTAWVIAGINWAITNKVGYHITALNMSLGDGSYNKSPCGNSRTNPFVAPVNSARSAGIIPVASSGNSAFADGMASPACTPGVVSVGAVYDANWGGPYTWSGSNCQDAAASAPDRIPCFSNSASFLTMLAPGAFITASGIQMAGTSQASPHVAGAVAVLRSAFASDTLDQTATRMTAGSVPVTDPRNGVTTPRLDLLASLGTPANDNFADRALLSGDTGTITSENANATKEAGEPAHAGNNGGRSVWWRWTPSLSGLASLSTAGSNFNTLLAVYTGTGVASLTGIVAADGGTESSVSFAAVAGMEYLIAVDGADAAFGSITLSRDIAIQADLSLSLSAPSTSTVGSDVTLAALITNAGPSQATGVTLDALLPAGVSLVSAPDACSLAGNTITCAVGDLAAGSSADLQIVVRPGSAGQVNFSASVAAQSADPVPGNNSGAAACSVAPPPAPVPALSPFAIAATIILLAGYLAARKESSRFES